VILRPAKTLLERGLIIHSGLHNTSKDPMNDVDLKAENTALRKQNKNLKALLEEALEIIRKLKEFVDRSGPAAKPKRKAAKKKAPAAVTRRAAARKAS
jgi:hypothetical protein